MRALLHFLDGGDVDGTQVGAAALLPDGEDGPGGVDQLAHLGIPVIGILQLLGQLQGILQGDMEGISDE